MAYFPLIQYGLHEKQLLRREEETQTEIWPHNELKSESERYRIQAYFISPLLFFFKVRKGSYEENTVRVLVWQRTHFCIR
jgi:hypothetical protein